MAGNHENVGAGRPINLPGAGRTDKSSWKNRETVAEKRVETEKPNLRAKPSQDLMDIWWRTTWLMDGALEADLTRRRFRRAEAKSLHRANHATLGTSVNQQRPTPPSYGRPRAGDDKPSGPSTWTQEFAYPHAGAPGGLRADHYM